MSSTTLDLSNPAVRYNRVPKVTPDFWIIKLLAVTVGETGADFLAQQMGVGLANTTWMMSALLVGVLVLQFSQKRYVPWAYWLAVVFISIVGTLITDYMVDLAGVSLEMSTFLFSGALLATFATWFASEKTLSIHTIFTTRREAFYWLAILFTFALGTAAGDLLAEGLALGYLPTTIIYACVIALIAGAYFALGLNSMLAFWLAYIITRPMGASLGDWLSQPVANSGLGFGTIVTSFLFLALIVATLVYMTRTHDGQDVAEPGNA
ncbi:MAG: hypothetical protein P1V13_06125 [Rhizobiaceae bacterium]|nr:hypothetical protein [Rhizobiaceae bacterium]